MNSLLVVTHSFFDNYVLIRIEDFFQTPKTSFRVPFLFCFLVMSSFFALCFAICESLFYRICFFSYRKEHADALSRT